MASEDELCIFYTSGASPASASFDILVHRDSEVLRHVDSRGAGAVAAL
jgi:hypothetical protein